MEEAYTALYQEFLRLQLLCVKQADMLRHLTAALRQQDVFNGHVDELHPELVQCRRDGLETFNHMKDRAQTANIHIPVAQAHTSSLHPAGDTAVLPLAGALDSLHLKSGQVKEAVDSVALGRQEKEERSILDELRQVEQRWHNSQRLPQQQHLPQRRPWSSSFLTSEMMSEAGGMLMSRVTLQSRVCEFCHAVFPGHTTTRGEFLRHLTTHIS